MICDKVREASLTFFACAETEQGSKFRTQCLYPSFQPVDVFVVGYGEGYKVHDGAGAVRSAWDHGRDVSTLRRILARQATAFHLLLEKDTLVAEVSSADWLMSAILTVANASAAAAHGAIEHHLASEESVLKEKIYAALSSAVPAKAIAKDPEVAGHSGKKHHFDYSVFAGPAAWLLISAVQPHHVSVSAKYVAFADVLAASVGVHQTRLAVHDRPLAGDDVALLSQVADLMPFASLGAGVAREVRTL